MRKILLTFIFTSMLINLYGQQDLNIGTSYQLLLQRQNVHGDAWMLHNAEYSQGDDLLKWKNSHTDFGSRGIRFSYCINRGIYFYADAGQSITGVEFSPTTRLFIANTGNIGIGTSAPGQRLSVVYNGNNNPPALGSDGGSFGIWEYDDDEGGDYGLMAGVQATGNVWMQVQRRDGMAAAYNLILQPNGGNIGIGTLDPGYYKLNVSGKIRANEIVVNTGGADFVFEPEYKLPELSEIAKYVKENKRLPDIPSAKEMQEAGMNVSEMQTKLLQKIEELTLYIIDLNKKIEELQSGN